MQNERLMRKTYTLLLGLSLAVMCLAGCGNKEEKEKEKEAIDKLPIENADGDIPMKELTINDGNFHKTYLVADIDDEAVYYKRDIKKANSIFVISKKDYRLYVYETGQDTTLAATFPVCYAINPEAKQGEGDNRTPECGMKNPFRIKEVVNAASWVFNFNDGRGDIPAFGHWFIRLDLCHSFPDNPALAANRSIGIHGSTGNELSIPGRDSHGCVRMYDEDLEVLHDKYLSESTTVIIKGIKEGKLPFEVRAIKALGDKYKAAKPGNPNLKEGAQIDEEEVPDEYEEVFQEEGEG